MGRGSILNRPTQRRTQELRGVIGLSIVQNIVRMHGGTATAHSEGPGRGSRFLITLPMTAQAKVAGGRQSEDNVQ
jgi:signal transduction histidine kinase